MEKKDLVKMDEAAGEVIEKCSEHAKIITENMNKMYLDFCNASLIVASEETYRNYFNEFIKDLFDLKSLSMARVFSITLTSKKEE